MLIVPTFLQKLIKLSYISFCTADYRLVVESNVSYVYFALLIQTKWIKAF